MFPSCCVGLSVSFFAFVRLFPCFFLISFLSPSFFPLCISFLQIIRLPVSARYGRLICLLCVKWTKVALHKQCSDLSASYNKWSLCIWALLYIPRITQSFHSTNQFLLAYTQGDLLSSSIHIKIFNFLLRASELILRVSPEMPRNCVKLRFVLNVRRVVKRSAAWFWWRLESEITVTQDRCCIALYGSLNAVNIYGECGQNRDVGLLLTSTRLNPY